MANLYGNASGEAAISAGSSVHDRLQFNANSGAGRSRRGQGGRGFRRGNAGRSRNNRGRDNWSHDDRTQTKTDRLDDEDERMDGTLRRGKTSRFTPYGDRRRPPRGIYRGGRGGHASGQLDGSRHDTTKWFKVVMFECKMLSKEQLLSSLRSLCDLSIDAIQFHRFGDDGSQHAGFYVDNEDLSVQLRNCSRKIDSGKGNKIVVSVKNSGPPKNFVSTKPKPASSQPINSQDLEPILQQCLAPKFNVEQQSLELQNMENDPILQQNGIKGAFYQHWFSSAVFKLISTLCPTLRGLDLSRNKLRHLSVLKDMPSMLPNLELLSLGNNELNKIDDLEVLKGLKNLKTLILDGNPLVNNYTGTPLAYASEIRKRLPQVETVDGQKLPPPISFDTPAALPLPDTKDNYLVDTNVQGAVSGFLQSYIEVFDSDNRQRLLDAYHDNAVFSMCANMNARDTSEVSDSQTQSLGSYTRWSRNLRRVSDQSKRSGLLKVTKSASVASLSTDFPKTRHDLASFNIDLIMATQSMMCFTVRGRFEEVETRKTRAFARTFVVVPNANASGFLIVNDQLQIRNVVVKGAPVQAVSTVAAVASPASAALQNSPAAQEELVGKFSEQSKMNLAFSRQCLLDNQWDYQRAAVVFTNLQATGKIPPEAFVS